MIYWVDMSSYDNDQRPTADSFGPGLIRALTLAVSQMEKGEKGGRHGATASLSTNHLL